MKLISFSLWGVNKKYLNGGIENARLAQIIYPEFKCVYYVNGCVPKDTIAELEKFDNVTIEYDPFPGSWLNMFDRFIPHFDKNNEVVLVRDCDSRLSWRERSCYDLWIKSDKGILALNDHPLHSLIIMGGLHASKNGAMRDMYNSFEKFLANCGDHSDRYQIDQDWLNEEVLPYKVGNIMWFNDFALRRGALPFPHPRQGLEFCGEILDAEGIPNQEHRQILKNYIIKNKDD